MRTPKLYKYTLDVGDKVVLSYLVFTYFIPMFLGSIYFYQLSSSYKIFYPNVLQLICLFFLIFFYLVLRPLVFRINFRPIRPISSVMRALVVRLGKMRTIFAVMTIMIAIYWAMSGYNLYRYSDGGMSSNLSFMLLLGIVAGLIIKIYFFRKIFFGEPSKKRSADILLALSLVIMVSGVFGILFAFLMLVYSFAPNTFLRFVFKHEDKRMQWTTAQILFLIVILFIFSIFSFFLGNVIKSNSIDGVFGVFMNAEYVNTFYLYLIERISSSYYAFAYSLTEEFQYIAPSSLESLEYIILSFFYRLDLILGGLMELERQEINSLMKINYLVLSEYPVNEREGTSAGLLGSFSYFFSLPFNIILSAVFLLFVARFFNQINYGGRNKRVTYLGSFLLLYFILPLFESPFDLLLIIDDGFIYVAIIFLLSMPYLKYRTAAR